MNAYELQTLDFTSQPAITCYSYRCKVCGWSTEDFESLDALEKAHDEETFEPCHGINNLKTIKTLF